MKQRVLIVDDSPFVRRLLTDWIKSEPDFEIISTAANGNEAVALAAQLKPDVITLDVEMPIRDGLSALEEIMKVSPCAVIMVSSVTTQGAEATLRALDLGAVDFVTKPQSGSSLQFLESRDELLSKLRACRNIQLGRTRRPPVKASSARIKSDCIVAIASSTGGPRALATLWESLPSDFGVPILITQHMPAGFTATLANRLDSLGTVPCREAVDGEVITPGQGYIAPGGYHMTIAGGKIRLDQNPPIHGVRPAADYLFQSVAGEYGSKTLALVLTGMGRDGTEGAVTLKKVGATVFGESEETCTIYGMPKSAKQAGATDAEFPIHEIGAAMVAALKERLKHAS